MLPNVKLVTDLTKLTEEYSKIENFDKELTTKMLSSYMKMF